MSGDSFSPCGQTELLRDYAFDELPAGDRPAIERHLAECADCAQEFDQLRLTTAALRMLPDREIPQRIAFVSDKVFQPSPLARFFGARLGFASACVLAAALVVFAYHRPAPQQVAVTAPVANNVDVSKQIDEAVAKAVAQVRQEDAKMTQTALAAYDQKNRAQWVALEESFSVLQKRVNTDTILASSTVPFSGAGQ
jgi:anti-sigma factor RsiW